MRVNPVLPGIGQETIKNENEKWTLQDMKYGEKH